MNILQRIFKKEIHIVCDVDVYAGDLIFGYIRLYQGKTRSFISFSQKTKSVIEINDINCGKINKHHGSMMIEELFQFCKNHSINQIDGWLSRVDYGHKDRLIHFYEKHGFVVTYEEDKNEPLQFATIRKIFE